MQRTILNFMPRPLRRPDFHRAEQNEAFCSGRYRQHLDLTAPLIVLTISSNPSRTMRLIDLTTARYPHGNVFMLFQTWENFGPVFRPPQPTPMLLTDEWERGGFPSFMIGMP